jgi:N-methylhydantoinase B
MPAFIGTAPFTMAHMLAKYPIEQWRPGDIVATNDPWLGTGHTPDICIARPVFNGARLVGFIMTISHLPDIGGGGMSAHNSESYHEGLVLPICKLYVAGEPDPTLHELIRVNVRGADIVAGDILANVSGCAVGERLIGELMAEYGLDDLQALADDIIGQSESAIRKSIQSIPDGVYKNRMDIETVGDTTEIVCAVTVRGDHIEIDFSGSGPAVPFAINVPLCYARAFSVYAIKCLTTPKIPNNQGATIPITVSAPEGCILNAQRPSPTGGRHLVGWYIVPLIMGALAEAIPDRVQADAGMASLFLVKAQGGAGAGAPVLYFLAGGLGAMAGLDGRHTTPSPTNNAVVASEIWEIETGMTVIERRLLPDSGGPGEFRGGLGQVARMINSTDHAKTILMFGMRTEFPARGYFGGGDGKPRRFEIDGETALARGKLVLAPGQTLSIFEAGGGGYGDPFKRPPAAVLKDVEVGAVSVKAALADYGVVVDLATGAAARRA